MMFSGYVSWDPLSGTASLNVTYPLLVTPATARRLEQIAAKRGTSASEVVRQAINAFDANGAETMESEELMELVSTRLKEAIRATRATRKMVAKTLNALSVTAV